MKSLVVLVSILFLITSCEEKHADNQLRILIRNGTDSLITVKLYPKSQYIKMGKYIYSDILTIFKDTTFVATGRLGSELYITSDISKEPQLLATEVFDSINVVIFSGKLLLKFSPQRVVNYSNNLFTDKNAWIHEINRFEQIKTWRKKFIESDDYIFIITRDK
jgi:hypothetical protein